MARKEQRDGQISVPVVEEQIAVGKREVDRGGVRVTSRVETVPVAESVRLREETLDVERRPADREATAADLDAFSEGTLEVRTRAEEAVVQKKARVVEEIVVGKETREREETIRDNVRRTDVTVEAVAADSPGFDDREPRSHYEQTFAKDGGTYADYSTAYRYGWALANDDKLRRTGWKKVEPSAKRTWEQTNQGTWDRFKDAVKFGFESKK